MLGTLRRSLAFLPVTLGLLACSSEDGFTANAAGKYTVAVTNGKSTCNNQGWEEGKTASGVAFDITQDGKSLTGKLTLGLGDILFNAVFGNGDFVGSIDGNTLTMIKSGNATNSGNCAFTWNATVDGTLDGDSLSGTITYAPKTNGNPDCASVECSATQKFNGSRPPQ